MMERFYQTIIVGAGPAGLIAGWYLEKAIILEKKKEIGKPVQCGEGISKKALEFQNIEPDSEWVCSQIHKIERIVPNGRVMGRWHKEVLGYVIDREKFEKWLARRCKAKIRLDSEVTDLKFKEKTWRVFTKKGEVFLAKYIIGADGFNSIVRRKIFPENKDKIKFLPAIGYLVRFEKEINQRAMRIYFDNEKYKEGYTWIFPKSKNSANVGVGGKGDLTKRFREFLDKLKREFGNYQLLENKSGTIPLKKESFKLFKNNVFLVGDAGGLADPLFKGGMNQAMLSGKLASELILKGTPHLYEKKIFSFPFANPKLIKASKIFYSLDNKILNDLGEILEEKGISYLKTPQGFLQFISKPSLLKSAPKIFKFFSLWWRSRDYLW